MKAFAFFLFLVFVFGLVACGNSVTSNAPATATRNTYPTKTPHSWPSIHTPKPSSGRSDDFEDIKIPDGMVRIEYRVDADPSSRASLTYNNESGNTEQIDPARLPWSKKFTVSENSRFFMYISAQNLRDRSPYGTITCEVYLNGRLIETATSSGQFTIATCSS
jgi:hypothetical protein